jgi:hypothetical protein
MAAEQLNCRIAKELILAELLKRERCCPAIQRDSDNPGSVTIVFDMLIFVAFIHYNQYIHYFMFMLSLVTHSTIQQPFTIMMIIGAHHPCDPPASLSHIMWESILPNWESLVL